MSSAAELLLHYFPTYGYVALFFIILLAGTYIPIPGGLVLIAVGAFGHQGYLNIFYAFFAAVSGSISSDTITFYIARRFGKHKGYKKYVANHKFAKRIEAFAQKYPKMTIIVSRFIGFATTPVDALMGLSQVRLSTFISMDAIGNALCTTIYLSIGYIIGITAAQSARFTTLFEIIAGVGVVFYICIFIAIRMMHE
jgi:membrane protein DedA with SNARE-associated domain